MEKHKYQVTIQKLYRSAAFDERYIVTVIVPKELRKDSWTSVHYNSKEGYTTTKWGAHRRAREFVAQLAPPKVVASYEIEW